METTRLPCPFLPELPREFTVEDIQALGTDRSEMFYSTALHYAQSLWLRGFPAKTLLLINRSLACSLPGVSLREGARPYHAVAWVLLHKPAGQFIGNPRRHYQHLATRMVEPHKDLRVWRAWACWYLAKLVLEEAEYPADAKQIRTEGIVEPTRSVIAAHLGSLSPNDDLLAWQEALSWAAETSGRRLHHDTQQIIRLRMIGVSELAIVHDLAHGIWPMVYATILSQEQIAYMLASMYELEVLRQEMEVRDVQYALMESGDEPMGYLAWETVPNDHSIFLHRLYLLPEWHGLGVGARALQWLEDLALGWKATALRLRVNRQNHQAIRAYLRRGFVFAGDICTDIGGGFVMDDHVMAKSLPEEIVI